MIFLLKYMINFYIFMTHRRDFIFFMIKKSSEELNIVTIGRINVCAYYSTARLMKMQMHIFKSYSQPIIVNAGL